MQGITDAKKLLPKDSWRKLTIRERRFIVLHYIQRRDRKRFSVNTFLPRSTYHRLKKHTSQLIKNAYFETKQQ